ncbi:uncharacterized protein LOC106160029 [Lingula anatina]|uniref:Uncharacterized protein LOC106160029 n=1 Tax=Lingula anatina TaxID=7574 RepID=A0A1S3I139_LINAN|nr:uncharacterized protein LOC106160029 [Lingula anatina]|eukprot:XP_013391975.1 uncharacterized protein LOC106160029 [Lingula anatina]
MTNRKMTTEVCRRWKWTTALLLLFGVTSLVYTLMYQYAGGLLNVQAPHRAGEQVSVTIPLSLPIGNASLTPYSAKEKVSTSRNLGNKTAGVLTPIQTGEQVTVTPSVSPPVGNASLVPSSVKEKVNASRNLGNKTSNVPTPLQAGEQVTATSSVSPPIGNASLVPSSVKEKVNASRNLGNKTSNVPTPLQAGEQVTATSSVSPPIGNASLVPSSVKEKVNASRNLGNKTSNVPTPLQAGEQVTATSSVSPPIGNASLVPSSVKEKVNASRNLGNKTSNVPTPLQAGEQVTATSSVSPPIGNASLVPSSVKEKVNASRNLGNKTSNVLTPLQAGEQVTATSSVSPPIGNASLVPSSVKEKVNASRNLGNKMQLLNSTKGEITHFENQGSLFGFTRLLPTVMPTVNESVSPVSTFMKEDSLTTPHQHLLPNQNTSSDLLMVWSHYIAIPQPLMDKIDTFFKLNPERNVVFVCGSSKCRDQIDEKLREHARVLRLRLPALAKGTPLDNFVFESAILKLVMGRRFQVLVHEVSVLLALWTFGGLYIDMQSIMTSKVPDEYFKGEWVGNESIFSISRFERRSQVIKNAMGVIQSAYSGHNRSQIFKMDIDSILWSSEVLSQLKSRKIEVGLREAVSNFLRGDHYGVLTHDHRAKDISAGDEIQTLAALQFLPFVDRFVDRDTWNVTCIETPAQTDNVGIFANVTENSRNRKRDNETITIFLNARYNAADLIWPPNDNLNPLMLSMSFGPSSWKKLFTEPGKYYLKEHGPVGARDESTLRVLREKNISVYMSACLTLLLQNSNPTVKQENVLVVDVDQRALELIVPYDIRKTAITVTYNLSNSIKFDRLARYETAHRLMEQYSRAKLVLTSRIHLALPCVAMGIPVVFVETAALSEGGGNRSEGLTELFHTVTVDKMMQSYKGLANFNWNKPEMNPNRVLNMRFRATLLQEVRKFPALRETAITIGRIPLNTFSQSNLNESAVLTFFQVYTTAEVTPWNRRSLESIFFHHPNAKVRILSNALSQEKVSAFSEAGFHVQEVSALLPADDTS